MRLGPPVAIPPKEGDLPMEKQHNRACGRAHHPLQILLVPLTRDHDEIIDKFAGVPLPLLDFVT